ncbi:PREDICTED: sorting nexin-18-like [Nipponia nippon]|uniref:sorting nexin-18-like n=1 Tax=Nipponia nippon TaxID=128390 RepID=UPI0005117E75|nr:PREDICTED: sorting nexin-18-like [Nipponia nippon]
MLMGKHEDLGAKQAQSPPENFFPSRGKKLTTTRQRQRLHPGGRQQAEKNLKRLNLQVLEPVKLSIKHSKHGSLETLPDYNRVIVLAARPECLSRVRAEAVEEREDFISKRRKGLAWWMDHMCSHPVLAQCDAFQHFLTCPSTDEKAWKQGKRKAEKDEMVGANFFLTISVPTGPGASLDLQEVESQVDGFKAFTKKMDESALQLNHTANEFARKQVTGFKKEYQKVGHSFKCLSQAFELDQQAFSAGLNQAIAFTAEAYDTIGDLFADQPRQDLDAVMDLLALYQGHLANFPDIIHVQKGALTKVKESKRHVEEGKMELQKAEGIQERCNIISFATLAEINHFHKIRVRDFKSQMQHFLQQQILFFQKVTQKLEEALHKYDSI